MDIGHASTALYNKIGEHLLCNKLILFFSTSYLFHVAVNVYFSHLTQLTFTTWRARNRCDMWCVKYCDEHCNIIIDIQ